MLSRCRTRLLREDKRAYVTPARIDSNLDRGIGEDLRSSFRVTVWLLANPPRPLLKLGLAPRVCRAVPRLCARLGPRNILPECRGACPLIRMYRLRHLRLRRSSASDGCHNHERLRESALITIWCGCRLSDSEAPRWHSDLFYLAPVFRIGLNALP